MEGLYTVTRRKTRLENIVICDVVTKKGFFRLFENEELENMEIIPASDKSKIILDEEKNILKINEKEYDITNKRVIMDRVY